MTTETNPNNAQLDPTQGTQSEPIDWEKRYKDLQSYHDKSKSDMVSKDDFAKVQSELQSLQGQSHINMQKEILGSMHPDFGAVMGSEEFGTWMESQPVAMQNAIYDEQKLDGALAGSALSLFKSQMGGAQAQATPDTTSEAAMAVSGGHRETPELNTKRQYTYAEIGAMHPNEYAQHREDILAAQKEGRIR